MKATTSLELVIATLLPVTTLIRLLLHGFPSPFDGQCRHHLCEVMKSFVDLVELLLDFFELLFIIDGSLSTRTVISR